MQGSNRGKEESNYWASSASLNGNVSISNEVCWASRRL